MNVPPVLEVHEEVALLLIDLGWRSSCDAQWTQLRDALPKIRDLLTNDDELRKASTDALSIIEVAAKIANSPMIDEATARLKSALKKGAKFPATFCSNCGGEFGPGDHGYSHCESHKDERRIS